MAGVTLSHRHVRRLANACGNPRTARLVNTVIAADTGTLAPHVTRSLANALGSRRAALDLVTVLNAGGGTLAQHTRRALKVACGDHTGEVLNTAAADME